MEEAINSQITPGKNRARCSLLPIHHSCIMHIRERETKQLLFSTSIIALWNHSVVYERSELNRVPIASAFLYFEGWLFGMSSGHSRVKRAAIADNKGTRLADIQL